MKYQNLSVVALTDRLTQGNKIDMAIWQLIRRFLFSRSLNESIVCEDHDASARPLDAAYVVILAMFQFRQYRKVGISIFHGTAVLEDCPTSANQDFE